MNTIKLALLSALSVTAINAHALDTNIKPYVGAELGAMAVDYTTESGVDYSSFYANQLVSASAHAGVELNERLAVEVGYINTSEKSKDFNIGANNLSSDIKLTGFYADMIGKHPITENVKALASVGITHLKADATYTNNGTGATVSTDEKKTSYRVGLGAEYKVNDKIDVRGTVRYMDTGIDVVESALQYAVGVNYKF